MGRMRSSKHFVWALGSNLLLALALLLSFFAPSWANPRPRRSLVPGNPMAYPPGNSHTAPPTTTVSLTYDEAISPTTVSTRTFAVQAMQTGLLTQVYYVFSGTISLLPTRPLKPGELLQVSATTGTLSLLDGAGPLAPTVWQFRTAVAGGSGLFVDSGQHLGNANSKAMMLGDLDGDGDLDACVANCWYQPNTVWLNDGSGMFVGSGQNLDGSWSYGLALGDVDGDADLDVFFASDGDNTVWLNDGAGWFSLGQSMAGSFSKDVALGDVDGDGDLDAFVANWGTSEVWLNDGAGSFGLGQTLNDLRSQGVALGDVDNDADLDALVANWEQVNMLWLNDGTGHFRIGQFLGDSWSMAIALGDLDGDGDLDAFIPNWYEQANEVWLNDGTGTFSDSGQRLGGEDSYSAALGDVDGDGDLDAFVANGGMNRVWLNDGAGYFDESGQDMALTNSQDVDLGDLDGDGDLDAFIANGAVSEQANRIWLNKNRADLTLSKTVTPSIAVPGQAITYTIRYVNRGPGVAQGAVITDVVPVTLTGVSYTYSGTVITPTGEISYTWQVAGLDVGGGGVITITGMISPFVAGAYSLTNQATITATVLDVNLGNNTSTVFHAVAPEPVHVIYLPIVLK